MGSRTLHARWLGRVEYEEALALQTELVEARRLGEVPDTLLLLERPPTITLGRGAKEKNLLKTREELRALGVKVIDVGRGGDVTYHGPGQLVGYPILDLSPDRQDVRKYVRSLEETMIQLCALSGLEAERLEGMNGTWIEPLSDRARKIGAVGVRISRWITKHGFAFNAAPDLRHYEWIIACGLVGKGVTSVERERGSALSTKEYALHAAKIFAKLHDATLHEGRVQDEAVSAELPVAGEISPPR